MNELTSPSQGYTKVSNSVHLVCQVGKHSLLTLLSACVYLFQVNYYQSSYQNFLITNNGSGFKRYISLYIDRLKLNYLCFNTYNITITFDLS